MSPNAPSWPEGLPKGFEVIGEPTFEPDVLETPTNSGISKRRRRSSAFFRVEIRRLRNLLSEGQVQKLAQFNSVTRKARFMWNAESVHIRSIISNPTHRGFEVSLTVDIFPSAGPEGP
jgi:hypothetical protein